MASSNSSSGADVPPVLPSIPLRPEFGKPRDQQSIGELVKEATTHVSTLVRSEIELAKSEVKSEVRRVIEGTVCFVLALALMVFSLFFLNFAIAELLALWLPRPAAFGIVFALMLVVAGLLGFIGYLRVRKVRKPERTISSLKESAEMLSHVGRGSENGAVRGYEARDGVSTH